MRMKNLIQNTLLVLVFILGNQQAALAVLSRWVSGPVDAPQTVTSVLDLPADDIFKLDKEQLAQKIGRSLTWKEKMALRWAKRKMKKEENKTKALNQARNDGMAIAGFVLGLLGLLAIGFLGSILGIIFSAIALDRFRKGSEMGGKNMAVAGLVLGIVGLVLWSLLIVLFVAVL